MTLPRAFSCSRFLLPLAILLLPLLDPAAAHARQTLDVAAADRIVAAAEAEADRNGWRVTIVVSDADGIPILVRRMDGASTRSVDFALGKARTVAAAGMSTAEYVAAVANGTIEPLPDATAIPGGVPLRVGGTLVGAVSASGLPPEQDLVVAEAGAAAFAP